MKTKIGDIEIDRNLMQEAIQELANDIGAAQILALLAIAEAIHDLNTTIQMQSWGKV